MQVARRWLERGAVVVIAMLAGGASLAHAQVVRHDFEDGTTQGWIPRGSAVLASTTDAAQNGARSLQTTGRTATWNGPSLDVLPTLQKGAIYEVSGWVRLLPGQPASTLKLTVERVPVGASAAFDQVATSTNNGVTDAAWVRLQGTYSFNTDVTRLLLYLESSDATGAYYLDNFSIVLLQPPPGGPPDQSGISTDFETGTTQGWRARIGRETVAVTTADAHGGIYSLLTTGRQAAFDGPSINVLGKMHKGSKYAIGLWAKLAPGMPDTQLRVSLQRTLGSTTNFDTVIGNRTVTASAWVQFSTEFTFNNDATALSLYVESASGTASFYIDDFTLRFVPAIPIQTDIPSLHEVLADYFPIGAAIEPFQTSGPHAELLLRHFNSITPENAMKFGSLQPTDGNFTFANADTLANFARANQLHMRGHTLVWHEQNPAWVFQDLSGNPMTPTPENKALLLQRLETHIRTVVARYSDVVDSWDVVNEAIDASQPDGLRRTPWFNIIGPEFIDRAFQIAHEVAPTAKLYINDFSTTNPAKRAAFFNVVRGMQMRGVPFDGVGHQMHNNIEQPTPADIRATIELFAGIGLDNQITEMDISVYTNGTDRYTVVPPEILAQQGHRYRETFREYRRLKQAISSVTLWGLADDTTWLKRFPITRLDQPLLFDESLQAKLAYWGIVDPSRLPVLTQTVEAPRDSAGPAGRAWELARATTFEGDPPASGATPLTGRFKVLWDDTHLYVQVDVLDPVLNWTDTVELFIDENNDKTMTYGGDDRRYLLRPQQGIPGGYRVVGTIPLQNVATIGKLMGFDVRITDAATNPARRLSWNDSTNGQNTDTSRFGVVRLTREVQVARAARGTPQIDGIQDASYAASDELTTNTFVLGTSGSTARVRTLWDDGHLYVFAQVTDPLLSKASANPWEQDSVEIFVDQNNAKTTSYEPDDGQYRVNFENTVSVGGAATPAKIVSATRLVDGGYIVEAAITFDVIPPQAGRLVGFDAQVNNDETGNGVRTSVATWSDTTGRAFQDPSRFGVIRLVP